MARPSICYLGVSNPSRGEQGGQRASVRLAEGGLGDCAHKGRCYLRVQVSTAKSRAYAVSALASALEA